MARMSRDKGKRGEREVVTLAREYGFNAQRTAALQAESDRSPGGAADVTFHDVPGIHLEVKRDERMAVDAMVRQATAEAGPHKVPVVIWRRNGGKWRADVPLEHYLSLLSQVAHGTHRPTTPVTVRSTVSIDGAALAKTVSERA